MFRSPGLKHHRTLGQLLYRLHQPVRDQRRGVMLGGCGVVLSAEALIVPDILYVSQERWHIIADDYVRGAPDLLVERISPLSARIVQNVRRDLYARHGVRHYW